MLYRIFESLPRRLQTRMIVWSVRAVSVCVIGTIGMTQYVFGDGILLPMFSGGRVLANLSLGDRDGARLEVQLTTRTDAGPGVTSSTQDPREAAPSVPSGAAARAVTSCDIALPDSSSLPDKRVHRVSFPSPTGGVIEGYGVDETLIPDRSSQPLTVLEWVRSQGGMTSVRQTAPPGRKGTQLPSLLSGAGVPEEEGDFLMGVAHGVVDLLSVGKGDYVGELNLWYHSLNAGFRTRILPALDCNGVGSGGSVDRTAMRAGSFGTIYVSDGNSSLDAFTVNGTPPGSVVGTEVKLAAPGFIKVAAILRASLGNGAGRAGDAHEGWSIENARVGETNTVTVELVANGKVVAKRSVTADGSAQPVSFDVPLEQSSWIALRLLGAGHSNPVYVTIDNKPVRASRASVDWSMRELLRDYEAKSSHWTPGDVEQARAAYEYAYTVYTRVMAETAMP